MASAATTNTTGRDVVGTATVGEGPKALVDRAKTLRFVFHNFEGMKQERDEQVYTPPLEAFGYLWGLKFYPKGHRNSKTDTEYVSVYLKYMGDNKYTPSAKSTVRCKNRKRILDTHVFGNVEVWGFHNYLKREDVLENYSEEDGSLIIEVDIRITVDSKRVWYPKKIPTETSLKESYTKALSSSSSNKPTEEESDNDTTDIVFVVDNVEFPVHKWVLSLRAKTLFAFYKEHTTTGTDGGNDADDDDDGRARAHISAIDSKTFKKVLEFIYTVNTTPTLVDAAAATELLLAAHRFECPSLQLYVESVMVDKFITPTNAASMLLLGDTYHCALLKEAALHNSFVDLTSFRESSDPATAAAWSKIQESARLLEELLVYTSNKSVVTRNPTTTTIVDVGTLREHLEDANLALDGSREVLVHRLRDYRQQH